jgi:hypothetical protein
MKPYFWGFAALLMLGGCITEPKPEDAKEKNLLTRANYELIQSNMARSEVVTILGEPDSCASRSETEPSPQDTPITWSVEVCTWGNHSNYSRPVAYVQITFFDSFVDKKEMSGLK